MRFVRASLLTAMLLALAPAAVPAHAAETVWLCRPGLANDPCEIPLDTTTFEPGGRTISVRVPIRPEQSRRPVDCFYVYPTVSNQLTANADLSRDPELESIAKYQAAPFSPYCRMYAPIYRQATLATIAQSQAGTANQDEVRAIAYADVEAAWKEYLARDNRGRGVVLIGHSQGTRMLRMLIQREIDPKPAVRRRLIGAVLLGGDVTVAEGRTVGGDFKHVPICTRRDQAGCVVAFSTYARDPQADSRFGVPDAAPDSFGLPGGPGYEVACTDPGLLSGMDRPVGITLPTEPFAFGPIYAGIIFTSGSVPPTAPTTWVQTSDRFHGYCERINGAHVLRYDPVGVSRRPNWFPEPGWGTHLVDVNYGLERQVAIVAAQVRTWLRR